MVNYYFSIFDLPFKLVLGSLIFLGIISIVSSVLYKINVAINKLGDTDHVFNYKKPKINCRTLIVGVVVTSLMYELDTMVKMLGFSIGLYVILSQAVGFVIGKFCNTNVLVVTSSELIDLNGSIQFIKFKDVKRIESSEGQIKIFEKYAFKLIRIHDFKNSENMISLIENKFIIELRRVD